MTATEIFTPSDIEAAAEELGLVMGLNRSDILNSAYARAGSRDSGAVGRQVGLMAQEVFTDPQGFGLTSGQVDAARRETQRYSLDERGRLANIGHALPDGSYPIGDESDVRDAATLILSQHGLPEPDAPEHHFRYDPAKAEWYVATTLAWAGDPGAEAIAREALKRMEHPAREHPRPRRAASARLDLALALAGSGKPDDAAEVTLEAVASPYLAPSNYWRADEVIAVVSETDRAAAGKLREAIGERRATSPAQNARQRQIERRPAG